MTDVSLRGFDGVLFTFAPGSVTDVDSRIASGAEVQALFGVGPAGGYAYDMEGPSKVITVRGSLFAVDTSRTSSGTTISVLQQKQWLEKQVNGNQSPKDFMSNYESTSWNINSFSQTKVVIGTIEFRESEEAPEELMFSMSLLVGGQ